MPNRSGSLPRNNPSDPPAKAGGSGKWRMGGGTDYLRDPLQMGLTIVGVTAALGGAGWWLDSRLGTFPVLMVIGAAAGLFGIIYISVIRLRESEKPSDHGGDLKP